MMCVCERERVYIVCEKKGNKNSHENKYDENIYTFFVDDEMKIKMKCTI